MHLSQTLLNQIISYLKRYDCINKVYLYGSYARGDAKNTSDIDIAIKFKVVCLNNLSKKKLLKNITKEGILIYENN